MKRVAGYRSVSTRLFTVENPIALRVIPGSSGTGAGSHTRDSS
jgi:hypothetical protein